MKTRAIQPEGWTWFGRSLVAIVIGRWDSHVATHSARPLDTRRDVYQRADNHTLPVRARPSLRVSPSHEFPLHFPTAMFLLLEGRSSVGKGPGIDKRDEVERRATQGLPTP